MLLYRLLGLINSISALMNIISRHTHGVIYKLLGRLLRYFTHWVLIVVCPYQSTPLAWNPLNYKWKGNILVFSDESSDCHYMVRLVLWIVWEWRSNIQYLHFQVYCLFSKFPLVFLPLFRLVSWWIMLRVLTEAC